MAIKMEENLEKILIFDDCFPYEVSGFRIAEYNGLFRAFPNSSLITTLSALDWLEHSTTKKETMSGYSFKFPHFADRVKLVELTSLDNEISSKSNTRLLYTIFLNNALDLLKPAELFKIPFIFTLYPGGGFRQGGNESDEKLKKIFTHPYFGGVIITQPITLRYVKRKFSKYIRNDKIKYIFGGVLQDNIRSDFEELNHSSHDTENSRDQINVCFVANKYSPLGRDKGLDIFLECANHFKKYSQINWHIVGPWNEDDLATATVKMTVHGMIPNEELNGFYRQMDISVFPTRSGELGKGSFDGFPVGAAVEAGKNGVVVVTTNPLKQKTPLNKGSAYLEIRQNHRSLARSLERLFNDPELLFSLKVNAQREFNAIYNIEVQMRPRIDFISKVLQENNPKHE